MKNPLFLSLLLMLFGNCNSVSEKKTKPAAISKKTIPFDWKDFDIKLQSPDIPYSQLLNEIHKTKITTDSIAILFENTLVNQIIPYWYGTPWDFNGHTNIPNKGKIACGYFVSTTLKHIGLNINRYKLAQQLPIHEAKSLSVGTEILEIKEERFEKCFEKMKKKVKRGIYFIGLDASHVGFLLKRKGEFFFIHSNYGTPQEVIIERANKSSVLKSYSHFYLSPISTNTKLMTYWKTGEKIPVITN